MNNLTTELTKDVGKILLLRLGNDLQAISISWVEEILPALPVESVPHCPGYVRGVVFVRGRIIPVLDAAQLLGMKAHQRPDEPHIVCLRIGDRRVGIEFDEALDLIDVGESKFLDAETVGADEGLFVGMIEHAGKMIRLINPEKLIGEPEAEELDRVSHTA